MRFFFIKAYSLHIISREFIIIQKKILFVINKLYLRRQKNAEISMFYVHQ
jgi:hypothetical protein